MGATNSRYATVFGKDYNIGPGASAKVATQLTMDGYGSVYASYKRYWIHTLSGAAGEEFVGLLRIGAAYDIQKSISVGLDFLLYERFGNYRRFADYTSVNSSVRMYVRQRF
jgi:hypothetical protein